MLGWIVEKKKHEREKKNLEIKSKRMWKIERAYATHCLLSSIHSLQFVLVILHVQVDETFVDS